MDVVALVPDRDHVCTRYRIAQFRDDLARVGLRLTLEPLARGAAARFRQLSRPMRGKVVFLQRKLLPMWQILLLRKSADVLVYDFDDAVFLRDSFHPRGGFSLTRTMRFQATVSLADFVLAGNEFLADEAGKRTASSKIHVIPTCVDPRRYKVADHTDHRPTRLVWIGSSSTLPTLEKARDVLEAIGSSIPNTILRVICDKFPKFNNLKVECAPWSSATEMDDLTQSDIGISWLPNDVWSRGKCGLKLLQYMASGLPVLASPVGVHRDIVDSDQGFLCVTPQDWVRRTRELVEDHRLREAMGRNGRGRLERKFDSSVWGPVLAERLSEAAATVRG